jgi:hypothetical protein
MKTTMEQDEKITALETIESQGFKRISDAIGVLWGNKECEEYLKRLIIDDRGNRAGFPEAVLRALLKLHNLHTQQFTFELTNDKFSINYGF